MSVDNSETGANIPATLVKTIYKGAGLVLNYCNPLWGGACIIYSENGSNGHHER